jgi:hypothetical protein
VPTEDEAGVENDADDDEEFLDLPPFDEGNISLKEVGFLVDHCNEIATSISFLPSSEISIDEMIALFKSSSFDVLKFKHKPIKEGYTFFAIAPMALSFISFHVATRITSGRSASL